MEPRDLDELRTSEELCDYQREVRSRLAELNLSYEGLPFPDNVRDEFAGLDKTNREIDRRLVEFENRRKVLADAANDPGKLERTTDTFNIGLKPTQRDIYDLSTIRTTLGRPEETARELRDRAMRAVETAKFPHDKANHEQTQTHISHLLDNIDTEKADLATRIVVTGSPTYKRAFGKYVAGRSRTPEEESTLTRALSLTTTAGGFAVPFVLDPSIIPTSNLAVNPYRAISRVEAINVDEWRGVSSPGITASYAAEVSATTDNAPTLAQPVVSTEKAQAFIPFSIEIGMDWGRLQSEMARLLQDAKDELETTKFTLGTGTNEPYGVVTGATNLFTASNTSSLVVADIYGAEAALGARFRTRASWIMGRATAQKIRQFDTAGGANLWVDNLRFGLNNEVPTPGNMGSTLLGYPAYECSAMSVAMTTGQKLAVFGDFSYYVIADRIGLSVEYIPHLFDATSGTPTGQRGLYAYWRNGAKVVHANGFVTLRLA